MCKIIQICSMDPNGQNPISIARLFEGINLRNIIDTHKQDAPLNLHIIQVNKVFPGLSALFQQKKAAIKGPSSLPTRYLGS